MSHGAVPMSVGERLSVRSIRFGDLNEKLVASWASLEERALEKNAYLSPRFVIPAIRHLGGPKDIRDTVFVLVEKKVIGRAELVGVGLFKQSPGIRNFPLPHLRAYRSIHSYLSGILVDQLEALEVMRALFRFFCAKTVRWHAVLFEYRLSEGSQARLMAMVAEEFGAAYHESTQGRRAVFVPSEGGEAYLQSHLSSRRNKELRRLRHRLEEHGEVDWKILFGHEVTWKNVELFLDLEHMGWKGAEGTSLRSRSNHESFFREIVDRFQEKEKLFFTELSLDGVAIASTTNLISGGAGFAFKIGWHPAYAKMSPGVLNEVEFVRHAPSVCRDLSCLDSGAEEGSFIDQLWIERRILTSGMFGTSAVGRTVLSCVDSLRGMKHRW